MWMCRCVGIDVGDGTDVVLFGAKKSYLEASIAGDDRIVEEVGLEKWFVRERDGVTCDVRGIFICGTGLYEFMMVRMSWICDCVTGFL